MTSKRVLSLEKLNLFSSELRKQNGEARARRARLKNSAAKWKEQQQDESEIMELELQIAMAKGHLESQKRLLRVVKSGGKESIEDLEAEAKVSYERKSRELLAIVSRQEAKMSRMSNKLQENQLRVKELREEEDRLLAEDSDETHVERIPAMLRRYVKKRGRRARRRLSGGGSGGGRI